ncbi:MAG: FkbM family methyltransferase [Pseudomonadota bacterium]
MTVLRVIGRQVLRVLLPVLPAGTVRWLYQTTSGRLRGAIAATEAPPRQGAVSPEPCQQPVRTCHVAAPAIARTAIRRPAAEGRRCTAHARVGHRRECRHLHRSASSGPRSGGRVVAVEPNPIMVERLNQNIALNGLGDCVDVRAIALSDAPGQTDLHVYAHNMGEASLRPDMRHQGRTITVETWTLSRLIADNPGFKTVVVKMDVEGLEDRVLRGILDDEAPCPIDHLLIETQHAGDWSYPLLERLAARGFQAMPSVEGNTFFSRR